MKNIGKVNSYVEIEINYDYSDKNIITFKSNGLYRNFGKKIYVTNCELV